MKKYLLLVMLLCCTQSWADAVIGKWRTIDDESGKPKSIVEISKNNGKYSGKIIYLEPDITNKCAGCSNKETPLIGLTVLKNFKQDNDTRYSGGSIFDPKSGKTYKSNLELVDHNNKLNVRGYIGISLIGRTQTWIRVK